MVIAKPSNQISEYDTAVIAASGSITGNIFLAGRVPTGITIPAVWTAAAITFEVSVDGVTFVDLFDLANAEYDIPTPTASSHHPVSSELFRGVMYIRIRSGTSATPVNQAAERTLTVSYGEPDKMF